MESNSFKAGMAEALGVFFLVFVGSSAICMDMHMAGPDRVGFGLLGIALAHGLALAIGVYATAGISGAHLNPAVTVALLVNGKISGSRALTYIVMQIVGAVIAALFVFGMFTKMREGLPWLGTPSYPDNPLTEGAISMPKAIGIEAILTFLLVMTVLMTAVDAARAAKQLFGLCIGGAVAMAILIGGPYTGAALNPARYFGPAVVSGHVSQMATYIVGPLLGGLAAALLYRFVFATRESSSPPA
ncbi:MIP family channel protein [Fimbriimonadia bacterium ATM]|nr:MAG: MIP family channel protein [Armatimonadota bacterium]MBC6969355.1 MIP family channel protein [Armatimonadota bacterium]MCE7899307.1 MIP family channel protein [Armatimonadetes bacterium ATM1]MDL1927880.1 MIP family channel protein [Fimbriimonadia bacterium ATM]RIJ97364.1 MAG: aquaporin [Armatimonadota bacterium]